MKSTKYIILASLLLGGSLNFAPAQALQVESLYDEVALSLNSGSTATQRERKNRNFERYAQQEQKQVSASQAKRIAQDYARGGKFINVQMVDNGTYRVRLQKKNGRIIDVYVDATTGRVKK